jgi:hypothetical protein
MQGAKKEHVEKHKAGAAPAVTKTAEPVQKPKAEPTPQPKPQPKPTSPAPTTPVPARPAIHGANNSTAGPVAKPMSDVDLDKARMKFARTATHEEFEAAGYYRGLESRTINTTLRTGEPFSRSGEPLTGESLDTHRKFMDFETKNLDSVLEKNRTDVPVVTYRGSESHPSFANLKPGEVFVDKGYMSTSTAKDTAMGGEFLFHITSPAGTKMGAIVADPTGFTGAWGGEKEILLGRGTALRLDRRDKTTEHGYEQTVMHFTVIGQH